MAPFSVGPIYGVLPVSSGSASLTEPLSGSTPRHVERSMQISRTPLSCSLCRKVYETQPIGGAFNPVGHQHLLHTIQPLPPSPSFISSVSALADRRPFFPAAPPSHHSPTTSHPPST